LQKGRQNDFGRFGGRRHGRRPRSHSIHRKGTSCRSYATKLDRFQRRIVGQPIISQAVIHGNVAYFAGITPNPIVGDIKTQTAQVLRRVDELLNLAGTDKSQLLSAQVWIADMRLFEDHNSVWNEWVDPANPPARACLTTDFWRPGMLVEVMVVAAVP
jgi:enamine deaminase RidA (YjgF/YER057c/UK114 family)